MERFILFLFNMGGIESQNQSEQPQLSKVAAKKELKQLNEDYEAKSSGFDLKNWEDLRKEFQEHQDLLKNSNLEEKDRMDLAYKSAFINGKILVIRFKPRNSKNDSSKKVSDELPRISRSEAMHYQKMATEAHDLMRLAAGVNASDDFIAENLLQLRAYEKMFSSYLETTESETANSAKKVKDLVQGKAQLGPNDDCTVTANANDQEIDVVMMKDGNVSSVTISTLFDPEGQVVFSQLVERTGEFAESGSLNNLDFKSLFVPAK